MTSLLGRDSESSDSDSLFLLEGPTILPARISLFVRTKTEIEESSIWLLKDICLAKTTCINQ